MRQIPEQANRSDWSRLVAQASRELDRRVSAVESPFTRRSITATTAALATDYLILADATAGAITVNLPAVALSDGAYLIIKKTDVSANAVTVDGNASETIDGAATQSITAQYDAITVLCDGAVWWIV